LVVCLWLRDTFSVHDSDTDKLPDSEFDAGSLNLLRAGNSGRMLDPRRTPIRIVGVTPEIGMFELEVTAFEDSGACWILPLEDVGGFQFEKGSTRLDERVVAVFEEAISRFSEGLLIDVDQDALVETERRLGDENEKSTEWLAEHSEFLRSLDGLDFEAPAGPTLLRCELIDYLEFRGLADIEHSLTETWVSNPRSGEFVKAHQVVMARMGLAPYDGLILRDPRSLKGPWSQLRREQHILARLGFIRSVFRQFDIHTVVLYRGLTFEQAPAEHRRPTLISATFRRSVAEAWLDSDPMRYAAVLIRQPAPVDRLFMTYLETEAMNSKYREAEAVLLPEPKGILF
jgi:hypothetical protein